MFDARVMFGHEFFSALPAFFLPATNGSNVSCLPNSGNQNWVSCLNWLSVQKQWLEILPATTVQTTSCNVARNQMMQQLSYSIKSLFWYIWHFNCVSLFNLHFPWSSLLRHAGSNVPLPVLFLQNPPSVDSYAARLAQRNDDRRPSPCGKDPWIRTQPTWS